MTFFVFEIGRRQCLFRVGRTQSLNFLPRFRTNSSRLIKRNERVLIRFYALDAFANVGDIVVGLTSGITNTRDGSTNSREKLEDQLNDGSFKYDVRAGLMQLCRCNATPVPLTSLRYTRLLFLYTTFIRCRIFMFFLGMLTSSPVSLFLYPHASDKRVAIVVPFYTRFYVCHVVPRISAMATSEICGWTCRDNCNLFDSILLKLT